MEHKWLSLSHWTVASSLKVLRLPQPSPPCADLLLSIQFTYLQLTRGRRLKRSMNMSCNKLLSQLTYIIWGWKAVYWGFSRWLPRNWVTTELPYHYLGWTVRLLSDSFPLKIRKRALVCWSAEPDVKAAGSLFKQRALVWDICIWHRTMRKCTQINNTTRTHQWLNNNWYAVHWCYQNWSQPQPPAGCSREQLLMCAAAAITVPQFFHSPYL